MLKDHQQSYYLLPSLIQFNFKCYVLKSMKIFQLYLENQEQFNFNYLLIQYFLKLLKIMKLFLNKEVKIFYN